MRSVVLYDSWYGNTEEIARAVAKSLTGQVEVVKVRHAASLNYDGVDLLVIGSPTHGGVASPALHEYFDRLDPASLEDVQVATFDTRMGSRWVRLLGYAGKRLHMLARMHGATLIGEPGGFFVVSKHGPLKPGEIERAKVWAKYISELALPSGQHVNAGT